MRLVMERGELLGGRRLSAHSIFGASVTLLTHALPRSFFVITPTASSR